MLHAYLEAGVDRVAVSWVLDIKSRFSPLVLPKNTKLSRMADEISQPV